MDTVEGPVRTQIEETEHGIIIVVYPVASAYIIAGAIPLAGGGVAAVLFFGSSAWLSILLLISGMLIAAFIIFLWLRNNTVRKWNIDLKNGLNEKGDQGNNMEMTLFYNVREHNEEGWIVEVKGEFCLKIYFTDSVFPRGRFMDLAKKHANISLVNCTEIPEAAAVFREKVQEEDSE